MTDPHLVVAVTDGRLAVTIDRADKRNALSRAVLAELRETFEHHAADDGLRVATLTGAGDKSFAAGGDLRDLATVRTVKEAKIMADQAKAALDAIGGFPVPVVAALNGDALGGGAELAAACDFRVAASHARIGFIQGRLNIATAWGGGIDLARIVGPARALRLLARGELLSGEQAMAVGLVDAAAGDGQALDDCLEGFLAPIMGQAPQVLRAFKALGLGARRGLPRDQLMRLETRLFADTWVHQDHWDAADKLLR
ncbi:MAG: enoyl-CoA hydratase/isomerase family protein [Alphaproteobacteria bacterium]|nr:enoyl-CoA hydratase/isomerase family protein [Alphaproteobacteria bacterium]MDP6515438.1 enoyl-CoA hydratase/isomerase family protein [Alphaproteobacteria bacterium]